MVAAARDEGLLTLLLGSFDPSVQLALDLRHESWDGIEADLPPNAVRVGSLEGEAPFRYLRLREPPYSDDELRGVGGSDSAAAERAPARLLLLHARGRADGARYAERLLELLGR